ncbi:MULTISPECIES: glycosyltransferase [Bacillaceae]|uniref:glycosyltransferase n=1 Tax=Bacillaceae TaxID=186817 RepID=UPI001F31517A|nr:MULTISPECIES: glycosyltransferase family 2 protein [Bacillaceae]MCF2649509.1 tetratricopeptide repeat protein [Niallia circulans]CAI9385717.1 hypothetical protein BACSP_00108 [Bacillus sp. T2.9-1]
MDIKVSLCMIVKNEERVLDRCLASVAHLVNEIIIVDTGSTDKTMDIAKKYTSKVYEFEWIQDFSAARNYAAEKATGDWILVLDADEYIDEENYQGFIQGLKRDKGQYDTYGVKILNFTGEYGENLIQNYHDRVYKNNGEIVYYRSIHEQLKHIHGGDLKGNVAKLIVFHSGYMNKIVQEKEKNERNKELIDKEMKESKNAFDYFNLGNEYYSLGEYQEALKAYMTAYNMKTSHELSWVATTVVQIISVLIQLKRYNDAINVIEDATSLYPSAAEFLFLRGEVSYMRGQLDDAKYHFQQIINHVNEYSHTILRPDLKEQMPHKRLGDIYLYEKKYDKAIFHFISVLNINKLDADSIKKVIFILDKFHNNQEIIEFIKKNNLINKNNIQHYINACYDFGKPNIILPFLKGDNEEKLMLEICELKRFCIEGTGEVESFEELLKIPVLEKLNEKNLINLVDLYLLSEGLKERNIFNSLIKGLENNEQFYLLTLLLGTERDIKIIEDEELYLGALQILMNYKKFSLVAAILTKVDLLSEKFITLVAANLYANDFKGEALQLYNKSDWEYYTEQDYLNIINGLIETGNIVNAIEFTKYAMLLFENDFRFYKLIVENSIDNQLIQTTVETALGIFKGSIYMEKFLL